MPARNRLAIIQYEFTRVIRTFLDLPQGPKSRASGSLTIEDGVLVMLGNYPKPTRMVLAARKGDLVIIGQPDYTTYVKSHGYQFYCNEIRMLVHHAAQYKRGRKLKVVEHPQLLTPETVAEAFLTTALKGI